MRYLTWTMRSGKVIRVSDMKDKHLYNTIKMLERNAERDQKAAAAEAQGTICSVEDLMPEPEVEWFLPPIYKSLVRVANARGIEL